jgi:hypothetical protein
MRPGTGVSGQHARRVGQAHAQRAQRADHAQQVADVVLADQAGLHRHRRALVQRKARPSPV